MAIYQSTISQILVWLAGDRQSYDYWPKGCPVDGNGNRILGGWSSLVDSKYTDSTARSQSLLKQICHHMSRAQSPDEKTDAVILVRFWKTSRGAECFKIHYHENAAGLAEIWETAKRVADRSWDFRHLELPGIKIAVASALVTAISATGGFGILDKYLGAVWKRHGWIDFDIRQDGYVESTTDNWNRYSEYLDDLESVRKAANTNNIRFIDPLSGNNTTAFTVHDVEMAMFRHYRA